MNDDRYARMIAPLRGVFGEPTSGKVRDTFRNPVSLTERFIVSSNRVSTHNVSHLTEFPQKGEILNALPIFWAQKVFGEDVPTHLIAWGKRIYDHLPKVTVNIYHPRLHYFGVIARQQNVTPTEFILRRRKAGSLDRACRDGWKDFGGVDPYGYGNAHSNLPLMHRFDEPLFTPTRKSKDDEPRDHSAVRQESPFETDLLAKVFAYGEKYLAERGITLVDAKGEASGAMLVDEWLTGDCCRMAWTKDVREGQEPPWLDKEVVRQEAMRMWGTGPKIPLRFSDDTVKNAMTRYHEAFEAITGMPLSSFQREYMD